MSVHSRLAPITCVQTTHPPQLPLPTTTMVIANRKVSPLNGAARPLNGAALNGVARLRIPSYRNASRVPGILKGRKVYVENSSGVSAGKPLSTECHPSSKKVGLRVTFSDTFPFMPRSGKSMFGERHYGDDKERVRPVNTTTRNLVRLVWKMLVLHNRLHEPAVVLNIPPYAAEARAYYTKAKTRMGTLALNTELRNIGLALAMYVHANSTSASDDSDLPEALIHTIPSFIVKATKMHPELAADGTLSKFLSLLHGRSPIARKVIVACDKDVRRIKPADFIRDGIARVMADSTLQSGHMGVRLPNGVVHCPECFMKNRRFTAPSECGDCGKVLTSRNVHVGFRPHTATAAGEVSTRANAIRCARVTCLAWCCHECFSRFKKCKEAYVCPTHTKALCPPTP